MKFTLTGKDFQSWKSFDLKVDGFTMVLGSSNRGKSALIRSLRGILRNQVQAAFVRHGQKAAELCLTVKDGPSVQLVRGKTTTYQVDGKAFAKLDGDVPQPVKDLAVHQIPIGSTKLDPTFAGQFDSQFMMDLSPADLNAVFGLFSNTEQLNQGKKSVNQTNTELNSQAKMLGQEIQDGHIKIAAIETLLQDFEFLAAKHDAIRGRIVAAQTAQTLLTQWGQSVRYVKVLRSLAQMPLETTERVTGWLTTGRTLRQAQKAKQYVQTAQELTQLAIRPAQWHLNIRRWGLCNQYVAVKTLVDAAPSTTPVSPVKLTDQVALLRSLQVWRKTRAKVQALESCLTPVQSNLDAPVHSLKALRDWSATDTRVKGLVWDSCKDEETLMGLHDELHELTKDSIECPKCGYQFPKE